MANEQIPDEQLGERTRALVMDGIRSGEGSEVNEAYFDRLREQIRTRPI